MPIFIRIQHSKVALLKPRRKTVEQALEEVEVAIKIGEARDKVELGIIFIKICKLKFKMNLRTRLFASTRFQGSIAGSL